MCTCGLLLFCLSSFEPFTSWGSCILSEVFFPLSFLGASGAKWHAAFTLSAANFFLVIKSVLVAVLLVLNSFFVSGERWLSMASLICLASNFSDSSLSGRFNQEPGIGSGCMQSSTIFFTSAIALTSKISIGSKKHLLCSRTT